MRAELRALIGEFVEAGKRYGTLRADFTAEDAFALLWTIAALVEAANDEPIWQRHIELVLDSLRGRPPRDLLAPPVDRAQWDRFCAPRCPRRSATEMVPSASPSSFSSP